MGTVALVYTPLAPLVPLLAAVVFWISGVVYKYQLMFVFTTKVESGGVSISFGVGIACNSDAQLPIASDSGTLSSTVC
jgi:hypothetical protein